jgi:hypothetical protein
LRQTPHHEPDHGEVDPGLFTAWKHFIVFGEPTPGGKPGEGALYYPSPFQHVEATGADLLPINDRLLWCPDATQTSPGVFNDLHFPTERLLDPGNKASFVVGTIGPDEFEARKATLERVQQEFAACVILDIGFMHQHLENQAIRINEQVPLSPLDFLPTVVAAKPPF